MTTAQAIVEHLKTLAESAQQEILDCVRFLESRRAEPAQRGEDRAWSHFSLASAMRGIEDEETPYTPADLKSYVGMSCAAMNGLTQDTRPSVSGGEN
jgi:hypothetical protein